MRDDDVLTVYHFLLTNANNRELKHGAISKAAANFGVSTRTIKRIRDRANTVEDPNDVPAALRKKYKGRVGRKCFSADDISERVSAVPFRQRGTLPILEAANGYSRPLLNRSIKRGQIHRH